MLAKQDSTEEYVIASARPHLVNWIVPAIFVGLSYHFYLASYIIYIFRINYICFVLMAIYTALRILRVQMVCTNKRIFLKYGLLFTHVKEMRLEKIESIEAEQSPLGYIFRYGSLTFVGNNSSIKFNLISHTKELKEYIESFL